MTIREIRKETTRWQAILNIPEWCVSVRWGTKTEMADAVGLCMWSPEEMVAEILIGRKHHDIMHTLIHELLHIVLEGHKAYTSKYSEMHERAINRLAAALLKTNA